MDNRTRADNLSKRADELEKQALELRRMSEEIISEMDTKVYSFHKDYWEWKQDERGYLVVKKK